MSDLPKLLALSFFLAFLLTIFQELSEPNPETSAASMSLTTPTISLNKHLNHG